MPSTPAKAVVAPLPPPTSSIFQQDLFKGKVLFCTGGGSGICKVIVNTMMGLGANAAILSRNAARLEAAAAELSRVTGRECIPVPGDVRKYADLEAAVAKTVERFGRIDYVVCGAAGNFLAPISGLSPNAFRTIVEIETIGTYNTVKATLNQVRATRGSYIHISATLQYRGTPFQAHVAAAKSGVDGISRVLAVEEGPRGVRSNVIAPGLTDSTEGVSRLVAQNPDGSVETGQSLVPLQRLGKSLEIAHAAVFLFSEAANFITGQMLAVDGGSEHTRSTPLPYPISVLDPEGAKSMIRARL